VKNKKKIILPGVETSNTTSSLPSISIARDKTTTLRGSSAGPKFKN